MKAKAMAERKKVVRTGGRQDGKRLDILSTVRLLWKLKNLDTLQVILRLLPISIGGRCSPSRSLLPIACCLLTLFAYCLFPSSASAQGNYEIQVYGSDLVPEGTTMVELHSNYTVSGTEAVPGSRFAADGTEPTSGALHETVEITQGFTTWFETGFYIFTSAHSGFGYE
ncbi:MAG TPA: hypothetical protein VH196_08490, partial [Terriglobales bacterium]|nr:hypothetical protein [Terriglobales bacterium]